MFNKWKNKNTNGAEQQRTKLRVAKAGQGKMVAKASRKQGVNAGGKGPAQ